MQTENPNLKPSFPVRDYFSAPTQDAAVVQMQGQSNMQNINNSPFGHPRCECHDCVQARWKMSGQNTPWQYQGQLQTGSQNLESLRTSQPPNPLSVKGVDLGGYTKSPNSGE